MDAETAVLAAEQTFFSSLVAANVATLDGLLTDFQISDKHAETASASALSSVPGSAIKRITAGVKSKRWSHRQARFGNGLPARSRN